MTALAMRSTSNVPQTSKLLFTSVNLSQVKLWNLIVNQRVAFDPRPRLGVNVDQ